MNLGGVGDLTPRDGVGDFGVGVGDFGVGVGDLGTGVEAGVEPGVGLLRDCGVAGALGGAGVGVLEGGAGDFGGTGVAAAGAALGCPSLGSGIFSPCL